MATKKKTTTAGRKRVTFQIANDSGKDVFLAGSFNDWDPAQKQLKDSNGNGLYTVTVLLPKGEHQYKFVVNGEWHVDPDCDNWVRNDLGTLNSVIDVK